MWQTFFLRFRDLTGAETSGPASGCFSLSGKVASSSRRPVWEGVLGFISDSVKKSTVLQLKHQLTLAVGNIE